MSQAGKRDRELGMDRGISRRDFLNGVGVTVGASLVAPNGIWGEMLHAADASYAPEKQSEYYPPAKTGMRGSHDGSWEMPCATGRNGPTPGRTTIPMT